jgi:DNA-binding response OmpR family regulator
MGNRILVISDDLFFWSRIHDAARASGRAVTRISDEASMESAFREGDVRRVIADLGVRSLDLLGWAVRWKGAPDPPELVAFGFHVDERAIEKAREAGFDRVVPNSRLNRQLPDFLS